MALSSVMSHSPNDKSRRPPSPSWRRDRRDWEPTRQRDRERDRNRARDREHDRDRERDRDRHRDWDRERSPRQDRDYDTYRRERDRDRIPHRRSENSDRFEQIRREMKHNPERKVEVYSTAAASPRGPTARKAPHDIQPLIMTLGELDDFVEQRAREKLASYKVMAPMRRSSVQRHHPYPAAERDQHRQDTTKNSRPEQIRLVPFSASQKQTNLVAPSVQNGQSSGVQSPVGDGQPTSGKKKRRRRRKKGKQQQQQQQPQQQTQQQLQIDGKSSGPQSTSTTTATANNTNGSKDNQSKKNGSTRQEAPRAPRNTNSFLMKFNTSIPDTAPNGTTPSFNMNSSFADVVKEDSPSTPPPFWPSPQSHTGQDSPFVTRTVGEDSPASSGRIPQSSPIPMPSPMFDESEASQEIQA